MGTREIPAVLLAGFGIPATKRGTELSTLINAPHGRDAFKHNSDARMVPLGLLLSACLLVYSLYLESLDASLAGSGLSSSTPRLQYSLCSQTQQPGMRQPRCALRTLLAWPAWGGPLGNALRAYSRPPRPAGWMKRSMPRCWKSLGLPCCRQDWSAAGCQGGQEVRPLPLPFVFTVCLTAQER
jgi:hypothetical protein